MAERGGRRFEREVIKVVATSVVVTILVPRRNYATFIGAFGDAFATALPERPLEKKKIRPVESYRETPKGVLVRVILTEEEATQIPALLKSFASKYSLVNGVELEDDEV